MFVSCFAPIARSDPPTLEHIHPTGIARGSTNTFTVAGKFEPWPPRVWASAPGLTFNAETNKGTFRLEVAVDAPLGTHFVRLHNTDGASDPRFLIVTAEAETLEAEPNDHFAKAQRIAKLPTTINGKLDKTGDVDSFAITLEKGQWLRAGVDAYLLMAKVDALARIVTTNGLQLAWNHDFATLDPRVVWCAPEAGTYVVQVMGFQYPAGSEVRLTGGDGCVYRLHLSASDSAPSNTPGGDSEKEPNDAIASAQKLALPASVNGQIDRAGDEDRFAFELAKDETIEAVVEATSLGSPLDAWLKIEDIAGKELVRVDDAEGSRDPRLEWKAPTNGVCVAAVGHLLRKGGPEFHYRLSFHRVPPDFKASLGTSAFAVTAGETNELKFNLTRLRGFDHKLTAALTGLPEGVSAAPVDVSEKGGEVALKLVAAADAKPYGGPMRLVVMDANTREERVLPAHLTSSSENNGVPGGYTKLLRDSIDQLWLTVRPKPARREGDGKK